MTAVDALAAGCLLAGGVLSLVAGVGLVRFPDLLSRMHASTKPQVLGLLLVLLAVGLRLERAGHVTALFLVGAFQLATAPVAAHVVGRAAYRQRRAGAPPLVPDDLAGRLDARQDEQRG